MQIIEKSRTRDRVRAVKKLMLSAGNHMASVHFIKRTDGSKRKMSYRLRVRKPTYAAIPKDKATFDNFLKRKENEKSNLITVFDCNKVRYNKKGKMNGRGDWRSIPLDSVTRIAVGGEIYKIVQ